MSAEPIHHHDPVFTLGDRLAKSRSLAGLTQGDMAARLFVSRTSVNNWERGHTHPTPRKLEAWATITGVRVGWLQDGDTRVYADPPRISRSRKRRRRRRPHHGGSPIRVTPLLLAS
jgi:transcriptional regulator with XRE-family HTH domain